ncbi:hypothetical protein SLE2022_060680 [Rubroshorea leprosula]
MEQTLGQDSPPTSGPVDKSRVLDIKPLRSLSPVFPSSSNGAAPFVCFPPSGPFPSGFAPFYPFSGSSDSGNPQTPFSMPNQPFGFATPISTAVPINSYRTANGDAGPSGKRPRGRPRLQRNTVVAEEDGFSDEQEQSTQYSSRGRKIKSMTPKRTKRGQDMNSTLPDVDTDAMVNNILESFQHMKFDASGADGDRDTVENILMINNLLRRKIALIEDSKEATSITKRPDLKAAAILMSKGIRTNARKRIGAVPGVEIGDIFYFRMELCLVGLHAPSMAGIDYMVLKTSQNEEPVAVSIVSSGGYEDNVEDGDVLIYSGQGGNLNLKDKEATDQKLVRGNLALEKSLHRGNEVRVIRGVKDPASLTGKIYVYDGLYKVQESWVEKGKAGCNVFRFKLIRVPGQPEAFTLWKSIQQWTDGITPRVGIILPDLTSGAENLPVSLVNDVDDEKGPAYFTYSPTLKFPKPVTSVEPSAGCTCHDGCVSGNSNCHCIQGNGGYLPYTSGGVLVSQKPLVHECGPSCQCSSTCKNRLSQGGLKVRLEVFKTKNKGWGLRSWDPIRVGGYICEYAGEVVDISRAEDENNNRYIFDATRTFQSAGDLPGESNEAPKVPFPLIISAKDVGNVARFMNHGCSPNVQWQAVLRGNKEYDLHIMFFALKNIPPMTELTYDYGMVPPDKVEQRKKKCLCGSPKCRGYFC